MKNRYVIVANGDLYTDIVGEIQKGDVVIGVDRAAHWLLSRGVTPHIAIGDFDSVTGKELAGIRNRVGEVVAYPAEKDYTDTELAVRLAIRRNAASIVIFGGSGSRLDHELGALHVLELCFKKGIPAEFRNRTNAIRLIGRGRTILTRRGGYRYVSVIPVTSYVDIALSKMRYSIGKTRIRRGQTIGISNEFLGCSAEATMYSGRAFVIQSRD